MEKTDRKYWRNGMDRRRNFWAFTASVGRLGAMVARAGGDAPTVGFFHLVWEKA